MLEGGFHLLLDLEDCNRRLLNSKSAMLRLCRECAKTMGVRVVQSGSHKFEPRGVTAFVIIAESHISIHTWPESGKAFMDIFTCQERFDSYRIYDFVTGFLGAKRGKLTLLFRRSGKSRVIFDRVLTPHTAMFDFGKTIFSVKSQYQRIELTKGPMGLSLFLDGYWQFVEAMEHVYHESLVHPALVCARRLKRVGIGGGGDGLALREVLKYPRLGRAELYEIDPAVLSLARNHPEMLRLNKGSLGHPKAHVKAENALKMFAPNANYDVLILDFPSISDGRNKFSELYSVPFYRRARKALAPEGILVTQVTDFPWNLKRIAGNLKRLFPYVLPVRVGIRGSIFSHVMASRVPFKQWRSVPPNLRFMTNRKIARLIFKQYKTYRKPSRMIGHTAEKMASASF
ncbi:MAG: adenosylmethionine decarboxylase [bacterium]